MKNVAILFSFLLLSFALLITESCCRYDKTLLVHDFGVGLELDTSSAGFATAEIDTVIIRSRNTRIGAALGVHDTFIRATNGNYLKLFHGKTYYEEALFIPFTSYRQDSVVVVFDKYMYGLFGQEVIYQSKEERCAKSTVKARYIRVNGVVVNLETDSRPASFVEVKNKNIILYKP